MAKPTTGRRWRVVSTGYFGTPKASSAKTPALRRKYMMEGGPTTAVGDRVSIGDIAVPSNVPLGSKIFVPGYGWGIAKDHGGAIRGNRIDLAFGGVNAAGTAHNPEAEKKALSWGKKAHTVYVFPASYQIPTDHSPPQAYRNDLSNKGKAPVKVAIANILPKGNGNLPSRSITSKKEGNALRDKILAASKKSPVIPTTKPATADSKAWFTHVESFNFNDPVHGSQDPSKFLGWSEVGSRAYKQKIDNIVNSSDSPEQKLGAIEEIKNGIEYQKVKNRMTPKDAISASDYADSKIESVQSSLMKPTVQPAKEESFVLKNAQQKIDSSKISTTKPVATVSGSNITAKSRVTSPIQMQQSVETGIRQPSLPIKKPKMTGSIVKDQSGNTGANPAKPQAPTKTVQTSMPALTQQVRSQVKPAEQKAEIKSNANPQIKGTADQSVSGVTKPLTTRKISTNAILESPLNEPLEPVDPAKTASPKVSTPEVQTRKPNSVLTNYIKRINTIDSLVDPSQYLQRKKMFLKEQAAIKDANNNLTSSERSKLLDTLGAYPEDNRKPQTLGGVVRAGNNAAQGSKR
jgi:3D (Asp-Asp-Asp) domain-containing protein